MSPEPPALPHPDAGLPGPAQPAQRGRIPKQHQLLRSCTYESTWGSLTLPTPPTTSCRGDSAVLPPILSAQHSEEVLLQVPVTKKTGEDAGIAGRAATGKEIG